MARCTITVDFPYPSPLEGSVTRLSPLFEEAYLDLRKLKEVVSPYLTYFLELIQNYTITSFKVEEEYHVDGREVYLAVYMNYYGNLTGEVRVKRGEEVVKIFSTVPHKGSTDPLWDLIISLEKEYDKIKGILRDLTPPPYGDVEVMVR